MKKTKGTRLLVQSSVVAAIYVALTLVSGMFGLSSGVLQLRLSEALCVLPVFTVSAVPGLFVGCIIANLITGSIALDIVFGSLATLIGAILTRKLRGNTLAALLPPILSNTLIIPFVLKYAYGFSGSVLYFMLTVGIGEILSCGVLGYIVITALKRHPNLFK
jgi:uncharacterized membrane protein